MGSTVIPRRLCAEDLRWVCFPQAETDRAALSALGMTLYFWGSRLLAKEVAQVASEVYRAWQPQHVNTLTALSNLSIVLCGCGEKRQAAAIAEEVYEARKKALGAEHPDTLTR